MGKKRIISVTLEAATPSVAFPANAVTAGLILVSIRTRKGGSGRKTRLGKTLINAATFQSASLTLKDRDGNSIIDAMPLEYIEHLSFNNLARGAMVERSDIDWNTSIVEFHDEAAVVAGEVVEFLFESEN